ncbi:MAG: Smr/MutS family protein [Candidatus Eremiobacterota bacterium]
MIDTDQVLEILERLQPATQHEGLQVELRQVVDDVVELTARRTRPGAPAAFVIKAIEGTFRRYYPEVAGVRLVDYDPGPESARETARAEDTSFAPLFRHGTPAPYPAPRGIPGVDLHGLNRADSVRALEAFVDLWGPRGVSPVKVAGLEEDAPRRAAQKWLHVYRDNYRARHPDEGRPGVLVLHLGESCEDPACCRERDEELIPGRILLTRPSLDAEPA